MKKNTNVVSEMALGVDSVNNKESVGIENVTYHEIGEIVVTSGSIVACDPLCQMGIEPFIVQVPNGSFPVHIAVVHPEKGEEHMAWATINFSFRKVKEWRPALIKTQDRYYSGEEISYYTVDSGIGCFMDAEVAELLLSKSKEESFRDYVIAELQKDPIHNCANIEINPETGGNVIAILTHYGDGFYDSIAGYDKSGKIVCISTDFSWDLMVGA